MNAEIRLYSPFLNMSLEGVKNFGKLKYVNFNGVEYEGLKRNLSSVELKNILKSLNLFYSGKINVYSLKVINYESKNLSSYFNYLLSNCVDKSFIFDAHNKIFSLALWLIKDNAVYIPFTYSFLSLLDKSYYKDIIKYDYNFTFANIVHRTNTMKSKSDGSYGEEIFNYSELILALLYYEKLMRVIEPSIISDNLLKKLKSGNEFSIFDFVDDNNHNSINKVILELYHARSNIDLNKKIVSYTTILEVLFNNNSKFITEQLVQRIPKLIYSDLKDIDRNKNLLRVSYSVRSNAVHNKKNKINYKEFNDIKTISMELDDLVRKVLTYFLLEDNLIELNERDYNNWLDSLFKRTK